MIIGFVGEDLVFVKGVQGLQARNYPATLATPQVRSVSVSMYVTSQLVISYGVKRVRQQEKYSC